MNLDLTVNKNPEEEELQRKLTELSELESDLIQKELDLSTLEARLFKFEANYIRQVGRKFSQLDDIQSRIDALYRHSAPTAKTKRNSDDEGDEPLGDVLREPDFVPSENLKQLFRNVAKALHPDFSLDEKDRTVRTDLMAKVNEAYKSSDEGELIRLFTEWNARPEQIIGDDIGARLIRAIRMIATVRQRLSKILLVQGEIVESEMYRLMARYESAGLEGRDLLAELSEALLTKIAREKKRYETLLGELSLSEKE